MTIILPFLISITLNDNLDDYFFQIINGGTIVNFLFQVTNRKKYLNKINFQIPEYAKFHNIKRQLLLFIFLGIILFSGIYTGITQSILRGISVEGLRRSAEVGIGFIRDIPTIGIKLLLLVILLQYAKSELWKSAILCVGVGFVFFLSTGHKNSFAIGLFLFICYYSLRFRGFRLYEYLIYYFLIPIGAASLQALRGGDLSSFGRYLGVFMSFPYVLFEANTIPIVTRIHQDGFLWGEEYFASLVKFIPRFLWEDKPLLFDYYFKELIGADFEGGGSPIQLIFSLYVNFGPFFILAYALWLFFIYKLYYYIGNENKKYIYRIICITILISGVLVTNVIFTIEMVILFMFVAILVFRRKYIF